LSDWKTKQEQEEKEFQRKREEEERKKQETIEKMKQEKLEEHRKKEEEFRKQQANKSTPSPSDPANICTKCKKNFADVTDIYIVKGIKYCRACSQLALSDKPGGPKCAHCGLPLEMTIVKAANRKYHPECLRCSQCGSVLTKGFRQQGRNFICVDCSGPLGMGK